MFYPVYENVDKLTIAKIEFDENNLETDDDGSEYRSNFVPDQFVYTEDVKIENYVGNFNEWSIYYIEDNTKCNTFYDAQIMLIQCVIK